VIAFISVGEITKFEPGFLKFKGKEQKVWNCNKPDLFLDEQGELAWGPGTRLKIDYNETDPAPGRRPSKYINNARPAKPDEPNTWPDKEAWSGNSGGGGGGVSHAKKDDYDPEVGKRQTAANVSGNIIANARQGGGFTVDDLDEFTVIFKAMADIVYGWVNEKPKSTDNGGADSQSGEDFGSETHEF